MAVKFPKVTLIEILALFSQQAYHSPATMIILLAKLTEPLAYLDAPSITLTQSE